MFARYNVKPSSNIKNFVRLNSEISKKSGGKVYNNINKDDPVTLDSNADSSEEISSKYSALASRFEQILEEKLKNSSPSLINTDPTLNKLYNKYQNSIDPKADHYIKSEPLLSSNKHAKQLFESKPWTGTESVEDSSLRMILDLIPKEKKVRKSILDSKESALDYKLNKDVNSSSDPSFRELYKERLLGPSMLIPQNPNFDIIGSVASAKVNAHIQKIGTEKMSSLKGKPLDPKHLQNCTDSNYFMNHILNSQQVLHPWVESQQSLSTQIDHFKLKLDDMWFKWIINKSDLSTFIHEMNYSLPDILKMFESSFNPLLQIYKLPQSDDEYIHAKAQELNQSIRSYNLQSPSAHLHKFKLVPQNEINQSFERTLKQFPSKFADWYEKNKVQSSPQIVIETKSSGGFLDLWGGGSGRATNRGDTIEIPIREMDNKLHLWKAVKNIFAK